MKNKFLLIVIIILLLILLIPIPMRLKDGGSIRFQALLYSVTKYHKLSETLDGNYIDGIGIEVLGVEIIDNTKPKTETHEEVIERIKLKDLSIIVEDIDTNQLVKFNGIVYGKSYGIIDYAGNINKSIGKIDFLIGQEYLPQLDGETNCEELLNSNVIEANEKCLVLNVKNEALLFRTIEYNDNQIYSSFVGTVLEETTTYMIVEPNEDEAERKSSNKIRINYGTDHRDYLYGIGRKVIINYTGYIKETYPAQIDTDNILTDGYENFELIVEEADNTDIRKILNNTELYKNNSDYDLFYVGLNEVNVNVDNKTITLEDALRSGKLTIDGIIKKANQDESNGLIKSNMYKDGGTMEYYYDNYTIIKRHTTEGDRDVYILKKGLTELDISYCREVVYE